MGLCRCWSSPGLRPRRHEVDPLIAVGSSLRDQRGGFSRQISMRNRLRIRGGETVPLGKPRSWKRVGLFLFVLTICHDISVAQGRVIETGHPYVPPETISSPDSL